MMAEFDEHIIEGAIFLSILTAILMITIGMYHPLIVIFFCAITTGLMFEIRNKFFNLSKYAWLCWLLITIIWLIICLIK